MGFGRRIQKTVWPGLTKNSSHTCVRPGLNFQFLHRIGPVQNSEKIEVQDRLGPEKEGCPDPSLLYEDWAEPGSGQARARTELQCVQHILLSLTIFSKKRDQYQTCECLNITLSTCVKGRILFKPITLSSILFHPNSILYILFYNPLLYVLILILFCPNMQLVENLLNCNLNSKRVFPNIL